MRLHFFAFRSFVDRQIALRRYDVIDVRNNQLGEVRGVGQLAHLNLRHFIPITSFRHFVFLLQFLQHQI